MAEFSRHRHHTALLIADFYAEMMNTLSHAVGRKVEDCCSDQQPDVHDFLTQRIFPRQADAVTSEDVIRALAQG